MIAFLQAGLGARMLEGGKYAILGFATVLLVLAAIWGVLTIFGLVFGKKKDEKPAAVAAPAPAPEKAVQADDGAIVAAITAAISAILADEAASENRETSGFRVVAFKRASKNRK